LERLRRENELLKQQQANVQPSIVTSPIQLGKSFRDRLKDGSLGPEMVQIPGGTFQMGDKQGFSEEKQVHTVSLQSFSLGKYEVTIREFKMFVEATHYEIEFKLDEGCYGWKGSRWEKRDSFNWKNTGFKQGNDHPVVCINWYDAKAYVRWLSEQTGKDYRLPSEAQWEYACRAGTTTKYWWGNKIGKNNANCYDCGSQWDNRQTSPIGSFKPNPFGLHDMNGNVYEWLEDIWHDNYNKAPSDGSAWTSGGEQEYRPIRGGSWSDSGWLSCSSRSGADSEGESSNWGFRVSRVNL
jgi:formylglycine-generating enzyme required for sulfatase activity